MTTRRRRQKRRQKRKINHCLLKLETVLDKYFMWEGFMLVTCRFQTSMVVVGLK
jgi:hypothetical protein